MERTYHHTSHSGLLGQSTTATTRQSVGTIRSASTAEMETATTMVVDPETRPMCFHTSKCGHVSEDDVLVVLVAQQVFALGCVFGVGALGGILLFQSRCFLDRSVSLLLARDFLEAVEFLAVELVELRVDVLDCVFCSRDDDVLTGWRLLVGGKQEAQRTPT